MADNSARDAFGAAVTDLVIAEAEQRGIALPDAVLALAQVVAALIVVLVPPAARREAVARFGRHLRAMVDLAAQAPEAGGPDPIEPGATHRGGRA